MPNRILRDWTDSEAVNSLSWQAECLFIRLIMKADDYGCFHGNEKLLKSLLFPLKDGLRDADIARWLTELSASGLIRKYSDEGGKPFIEIRNYNQRLKNSRRKFPEPPEDSRNFPELPGTSRNFPAEMESETETVKKETSSPKKEPPEEDIRVLRIVEKLVSSYPKRFALESGRRSALKVLHRLHDGGEDLEAAGSRLLEAVKHYAVFYGKLPENRRRYAWSMEKFFDAGHYSDDPSFWNLSGDETREMAEDVPEDPDAAIRRMQGL